MNVLIFVAVLLFGISTAAQREGITARQAKDHVGKMEIVCGKVVSARYASRSKGEPTFLNLDEPYPNEIFTIVIWGESRPKFGTPESKYSEADVCVTGKISIYRGIPEIVAAEPGQIVSQKRRR
jgi:hypothetical protein